MARVASAKAMTAAKKKFEREMFLVDLLMRRLGLSAERYIDPKNASDETGADVLAVVGGRQIGIQVTEVDTGDEPGRSRLNTAIAVAAFQFVHGLVADGEVGPDTAGALGVRLT